MLVAKPSHRNHIQRIIKEKRPKRTQEIDMATAITEKDRWGESHRRKNGNTYIAKVGWKVVAVLMERLVERAMVIRE